MRRLMTVGAAGALVAATVSLTGTAATAAPAPGVKFIDAGQSSAQVDRFWTKERIASAKEYRAPAAPAVSADSSTVDASTQGPQYVRAGTLPKAEPGQVTSQWRKPPALGRLFFSLHGQTWMCSATVVVSDNHDVISTARHCGFGEGGSNYRFAPAYANGHAPRGWFTWRKAGWVTTPGVKGDNAFIVLNKRAGKHVQDAAGSEGVAFNYKPSQYYTNLLGIPGDKDYPWRCSGQPKGSSDKRIIYLAHCNGMSGGASGGPFLIKFNANTGVGWQTASYYGSCGHDACGAQWQSTALSVYRGAQHR
ncbi:hypothetical protein [Actinomadura rupiterrae]|uniref:hypothetical protein n=1 Tax=Actinomadura rupiterrae TaxID=559627 RepID=UPI0020A4324A|nr:hypothetical protein [Actinomadura rupiterrae]MCP2339615.1 hypothetical protein [Actinomadura rupiterrae]